jgi:hypothetical protein
MTITAKQKETEKKNTTQHTNTALITPFENIPAMQVK